MNSQKDTIWGKDYQNSCIDEVTSILLSGHYVLIIISGMRLHIMPKIVISTFCFMHYSYILKF